MTDVLGEVVLFARWKQNFDVVFMSFRDRLGSFLNVLKPARDQIQREDMRLVSEFVETRIPTPRQLRYLPALFTSDERKFIGFLGLVVALCIAALGVSWYAGNEGHTVSGGEYREAVIGYPQAINPVLAQPGSTDALLSTLVYRKLFVWDDKGNLTPDLVERFEVGDGGKRYTVYLKQNISWEDGELVSADDVVFTFSLIADPETRSPLFRRFAGVSVVAEGESTVIFTLPETYGLFPSLLTVGILPQHIWFASTGNRALLSTYNQRPIGNGPFSFHRFGRDEQGTITFYDFVRNETYSGTRPYLDTLRMQFYPDQRSAQEAFLAGSVDGFVPRDVTESQLASLPESKGVGSERLAQPELALVGLNTKSEYWKDRGLRNLIARSFDRTVFVDDGLNGFGDPISSVFEIYPEYATSTNYAMVEAEAFAKSMEGLGWKREGDTWKKGSAILAFSVVVQDVPELRNISRLIVDQMAERNIAVSIELLDLASFRERLRTRNYDAVLTIIDIGWTRDYYSLFHSSQTPLAGLNAPLYADRETDVALQNIRVAQTDEERSRAFETFMRSVGDEHVWVPLVRRVLPFIHHTSIRGMSHEALVRFDDRFHSINSWYVKMRRW